jgi:hypothetical protein
MLFWVVKKVFTITLVLWKINLKNLNFSDNINYINFYLTKFLSYGILYR